MALDDVVQGVKVNVSTDGVDDAKSKLGDLDSAIQKVAKSAGDAAGGGGSGGGTGIGSLTKAFADLSMTGANAFSQILGNAASGDLTGLATMMGGNVAGGVVKAAESFKQFTDAQAAAALKTAALAKELGTTPEIADGLKEGFEGAGISANSFERLVNRMSRQIVTDYRAMTRDVRESDDTLAESSLSVQKAWIARQEAYGVPKEVFADQEQLIRQKEADVALDRAQQHERDVALKDVPTIAQNLRQAAAAHKEWGDQGEVAMQKMREGIMRLVKQEGGDPTDPLQVLKKEFDLIQSGAINAKTATELFRESMGQMRGSGLEGMAPANLVELAKSGQAGQILNKAMIGQMPTQQLGIGQTTQDTVNFQQYLASKTEAVNLIDAMMKKIGSWGAANVATPFFNGLTDFLEKTIKLAQGVGSGQVFSSPGNTFKSFSELGKEINEGDWWGAGLARRVLGVDMSNTAPKGMTSPMPPGLTPEQQPTFMDAFKNFFGFGPGQPSGPKPGTWTEPQERLAEQNAYTQGRHFQISVLDTDENRQRKLAGLQPVNPNIYDLQDRARAMGISYHLGADTGSSIVPTHDEMFHQMQQQVAQPSGVAAAGEAVASDIKTGGDAISSALSTVAQAISSAFTGTTTNSPGAVNVPSGQWGGGAIRGYYGGGRVRYSIPGFADGGSTDSVANRSWKMVRNWTGRAYDKANDALNNRSLAPSMIRDRLLGIYAQEGIVGGLAHLGIEGVEGAVETGLGAVTTGLSNPLGIGVLDSTEAASADYNSGANLEEAAGRAMGAHNALEAAWLRRHGGGIPMWTGGYIPGFDDGGYVPTALQVQIRAAEEDLSAMSKKKGETNDAYDDRQRQAQHKVDILKAHRQDLITAAQNRQAAQEAAKHKREIDELEKEMEHPMPDDSAYMSSVPMSEPNTINGGTTATIDQYGKLIFNANESFWGGGLPGFATGSIRGPGTSTSDGILARLSNGEFVMRAASVRAYGEGFMHAINNMSIPPPKYSMGGMVPTPALPRFAEGGMMGKADSIINLHVGGEVYGPMKAPEAVASQLRKFAIGQQTTSTGRKPSWST